MINWTLDKREILSESDFPDGAIGFIYELHFSNGRKYIGRKILLHKRTRAALKVRNEKELITLIVVGENMKVQ